MQRSLEAIAKSRERRARKMDEMAAQNVKCLPSRPGTSMSLRPRDPLFLQDKGVMCISPVSPSNPLSPGTFLSNVMQKKLRLSKDKARRKRQAAAEREKHEVQEKRKKRAWLTLLQDNHPSKNGDVTRLELTKLVDTVNRRMGQVMRMKEGLECFSATQRDKVYHHLMQFELAVRTLTGVLMPPPTSPQGGAGQGAEMKDESATILSCKQAILRCKDVLGLLTQALGAVDKMTEAQQKLRLQDVSRKLVQEVDESSNEVEDHFGIVRLFAPLEALKLQNSLKRDLGSAFLKRMGIDDMRVTEGHLNAKLEGMFAEIDADGGGDIDFEEMSNGLSDMGVRVSDKELKRFLREFDSDGNMSLDLDEFKAMIKAVLRDCKVVIEKDGDALRLHTKRPARIRVEEEGADDGTRKSFECKQSATPGLRKLKGPVQYSHLCTPTHILKRRVEVANKKAAMKKTRSISLEGESQSETTPSSRTPSAGIAKVKKAGHLRMPRGVHLKPITGTSLHDSPARQRLRTPSSSRTPKTPISKTWVMSSYGSSKHV